MAGGREIKTKIKSVQNTRKVTRALEMVSASKTRKAQERMKQSRPYARLMKQMIGHLAKANSEYVHPFLAERQEIKRVGYIIVSTDRGLCGGLNSGMFRRILADMKQWRDQNVEIDLVCIGQKGTAFFRRLKVNMLASVSHLGEQVHVDQLVGVIKVMLDGYSEGKLDRVFLCYNDFINTIAQKPRQGLHLRTRRAAGARPCADALCRVSRVPVGARKSGQRARGAHGGDEGRLRQRDQADRHAEPHLQQGTPGRDHAGNLRDRRRRGGGLIARHFIQTGDACERNATRH